MSSLLSSEASKVSPAKADFERSMIEVFGDLADLFGNPRTHGQIYGVLFTSPEPLLMEEISKRADISLGSASLGLRVLEDFGVVQREVKGRLGYYSAKLELKTLINGFIHHRLVPKLGKSRETLKDAAALLESMTAEEAREAAWRLQRVTQWHTRAAQFLPLAEKILQSASRLKPNTRP